MKKIGSYASSGIESLARLAAQIADTSHPTRHSARGISRTGSASKPYKVADVFLDHPVITTYHRLVQSRFVRKFLQGQTFTQFQKVGS